MDDSAQQRMANGLSQKFAKPLAYDRDFVIGCETFAEVVSSMPEAHPLVLAEAFLERVNAQFSQKMTEEVVGMINASIALVSAYTSHPEEKLIGMGERADDDDYDIDVAARITGDLFTPLLNGYDRNLHHRLTEHVLDGLGIAVQLNVAQPHRSSRSL